MTYDMCQRSKRQFPFERLREIAEAIFPVSPITAIVCFVFIRFLFLMMQIYDQAMPQSIAFAQEKPLTKVNELPHYL